MSLPSTTKQRKPIRNFKEQSKRALHRHCNFLGGTCDKVKRHLLAIASNKVKRLGLTLATREDLHNPQQITREKSQKTRKSPIYQQK
jgi:hypothetical protein